MLKREGVSLMELGFGQCRWPIRTSGETLFCGEPAQGGCSWCQRHRSVAFVQRFSAPKRRR